MSGRSGSFGFQVVGGADTSCPSRVEVVLPGVCLCWPRLAGHSLKRVCPLPAGSAAEEAGLQAGDEIVSVNKRDISGHTHSQLVRMIKKVGSLLARYCVWLYPVLSVAAGWGRGQHRDGPGEGIETCW